MGSLGTQALCALERQMWMKRQQQHTRLGGFNPVSHSRDSTFLRSMQWLYLPLLNTYLFLSEQISHKIFTRY